MLAANDPAARISRNCEDCHERGFETIASGTRFSAMWFRAVLPDLRRLPG